jgi:hypothetical protein
LKTEANSTGGSGSSAHTMPFVFAAAGCVVALLVGGFSRLNKRKEMTPLEKLNEVSPEIARH